MSCDSELYTLLAGRTSAAQLHMNPLQSPPIMCSETSLSEIWRDDRLNSAMFLLLLWSKKVWWRQFPHPETPCTATHFSNVLFVCCTDVNHATYHCGFSDWTCRFWETLVNVAQWIRHLLGKEEAKTSMAQQMYSWTSWLEFPAWKSARTSASWHNPQVATCWLNQGASNILLSLTNTTEEEPSLWPPARSTQCRGSNCTKHWWV